MPNHVINLVTFDGKKEDISKLREAIKGYNGNADEDTAIDFNKIIECPEELNVESGSKEYHAQEVIEYSKEHNCTLKEAILENVNVDLSDTQIYLSNYEKYGYTSWYDWNRENWGTKWNAYEQENISDKQISFQTAWSTPYPLMQELSKQFHGITITVEFADEDIGSNCGTYVCIDGSVIDENVSNYNTDSIEFACSLWGLDAEEYMIDHDE